MSSFDSSSERSICESVDLRLSPVCDVASSKEDDISVSRRDSSCSYEVKRSDTAVMVDDVYCVMVDDELVRCTGSGFSSSELGFEKQRHRAAANYILSCSISFWRRLDGLNMYDSYI